MSENENRNAVIVGKPGSGQSRAVKLRILAGGPDQAEWDAELLREVQAIRDAGDAIENPVTIDPKADVVTARDDQEAP